MMGKISYQNNPKTGSRRDGMVSIQKEGIRQKSIIFKLVVTGFVMLLILSMPLAIVLGSVSIPYETVWKIVVSELPIIGDGVAVNWTQAERNIVWEIRLPRVFLGAVVGAGLAVVGVAIQTLVRNSLADPYILGVSSGASVGATLVIMLGAFKLFGQYALSMAAFLGALLSVALLFFIATRGRKLSTVRLLLTGIAVSAMLSAVTSLIIMTAPQREGLHNALFWMMGSLSGAKWDFLPIPAFVVFVGITFLMIQSRALNVMLMGEETAETLGMKIDLFRKVLLILTALLTGVLVAVSGAIGFVGLMIPHIVRLIVGSDHRRVLPVSALVGALFLLWADVAARLLFAPEEIPIGIITALCGGPFFIWLLQRSTYSFGGEGR